MKKSIIALVLTTAFWGQAAIAANTTALPLDLIENAAESGNADAQNKLGMMYLEGNGVSQDSYQASDWLRKSAEQNDARSLAQLKKAAEQGVERAQYSLGMMYLNGNGAQQNYTESTKWFRKIVDQGSYEEGIAGIRKAAELGNAYAQDVLGLIYGNGQGVDVDFGQALTWFRKSAEQGYVSAQGHLGTAYEKGFGVAQDYAEAITWYSKAAKQGDVGSQLQLGVMYEKGMGVTQDFVQAISWYTKAAEEGSYHAQSNLATMYAKGTGVKADNKLAYVWSSVAATSWDPKDDAAGYAEVVKNRDTYAQTLTPAVLAEAQKLAGKYVTLYQYKPKQ